MPNPATRSRESRLPNGNVSGLEYASATCKYAGVLDLDVVPAFRTWAEAAPSKSKRLESFRREGFCILPNVIDSDELRELRDDYVRLAKNWKLHSRGGRFDFEARQKGFTISPTENRIIGSTDLRKIEGLELPAFRKIGDAHLFSNAYERLARNPTIIEFVHEIMGPRISLFLEAIFPKVAKFAREKPWHHDADYWLEDWEAPELVVQTMTAIDPHRAEMGGLQVIPRSHHESWSHFFRMEQKVDLDDITLGRAVYVELEPGDTLVFDSRLLHASMPNKSERDRCVVYNAFSPPSVIYKGGKKAPQLLTISPL